ncbi:hypothetical protein DERP_014131 [Dermatophagoides pteronyssinus]|uniref:Uncharacterized protein n=1 Tax=Dermatophagoides pteronyssinus TaxID=6956 RepID=A0ABQ8IXE5_DERPT|nr:hypothetical protein DERP_014131 [Dermatophagoides pteronyssinus]
MNKNDMTNIRKKYVYKIENHYYNFKFQNQFQCIRMHYDNLLQIYSICSYDNFHSFKSLYNI